MNKNLSGSLSGVIDEMLSGSVAGNVQFETGGGSNVTITPTLTEGTKVADYTIDGSEGVLYAPTPEPPIEYTAGNNITIENGVISATGDTSNNYTLDEVVVGSWVDGKPIYRKGFNLNSLTYSTNWSDFNHNISNIKRVIKTYGNLINNDNGQLFALPIYRSNTNQGIIIGVSDTKILYINNWLQNTKEIYIFIEYTKTTD